MTRTAVGFAATRLCSRERSRAPVARLGRPRPLDLALGSVVVRLGLARPRDDVRARSARLGRANDERLRPEAAGDRLVRPALRAARGLFGQDEPALLVSVLVCQAATLALVFAAVRRLAGDGAALVATLFSSRGRRSSSR